MELNDLQWEVIAHKESVQVVKTRTVNQPEVKMFIVVMEMQDGTRAYLNCNMYGEQRSMETVDLCNAYQIPLRSAALEFADRARPYFNAKKVRVETFESAVAIERKENLARFH